MTRPRQSLRSVLVDAGAWLALADTRDDHHLTALAVQQLLARQRPRLVVTNFIVDESYTLMLYRLTSHGLAVRFLDDVSASSITRVRITPNDERQAEALLRRYDDKRFSYTDATSFVVIQRLGIDAAFTFDRNFVQFGLAVLPDPRGGV